MQGLTQNLRNRYDIGKISEVNEVALSGAAVHEIDLDLPNIPAYKILSIEIMIEKEMGGDITPYIYSNNDLDSSHYNNARIYDNAGTMTREALTVGSQLKHIISYDPPNHYFLTPLYVGYGSDEMIMQGFGYDIPNDNLEYYEVTLRLNDEKEITSIHLRHDTGTDTTDGFIDAEDGFYGSFIKVRSLL